MYFVEMITAIVNYGENNFYENKTEALFASAIFGLDQELRSQERWRSGPLPSSSLLISR
jgi:hypothetical protein